MSKMLMAATLALLGGTAMAQGINPYRLLPGPNGTVTIAPTVVGSVPAGSFVPQTSMLASVLFQVDAAAPASPALPIAGTLGIQVDGTGNVAAVSLADGQVLFNGYGKALLVASGGAAGRAYLHDVPSNFNAGWEALKIPLPYEVALEQVGQSLDALLVIRPLAPNSNELIRLLAGTNGFAVYGAAGAADCALTISDNRGAATATEPSTAATACGNWQVLEVIANAQAGTLSLLRNGRVTVTTPVGPVAGYKPSISHLMNNCQCDLAFAEFTIGLPSLAQRAGELARLATLYGITGTAAPTFGPAVALPSQPPLPPDTTLTFLSTVNRPTTPLPSIAGSVPGYGIPSTGLVPVFDAIFGSANPGANVTAATDIPALFWNNYLSGDMTNPFGSPGDTGQGSPVFHAVARHYAPGDVNDVMPLAADGLKFKAICSQNHTDCSVGNVWAAFARLPNVFKPPMYIQVDRRTAPGNHEWNPLWMFSGEQPIPAPGTAIGSTIRQPLEQYILEMDTDDQFSRFGEGTATGKQVNTGTANIYGDNYHVAPRPIYSANGNGYIYHAIIPPFFETPFDQSLARHSIGLNWRINNLMDVLIDGKVIATHYVEWENACSRYTDSTGTSVCAGLHMMLGNQAIPIFSPGEGTAIENDGITTAGFEGWTQTIYRIAAWNGSIQNPDSLRITPINATPVVTRNGPVPPIGQHGLTLGDSGSAYVARAAGQVIGAKAFVVRWTGSFTPEDLTSGVKMIGGWGNYDDEWRFRLTPGGLLEADWKGADTLGVAQYNYVFSTLGFTPVRDVFYDLEMQVDPVAGAVSFFANLANGTRTQLGTTTSTAGSGVSAAPTQRPLTVPMSMRTNLQIGQGNNDSREGPTTDGNNQFHGTFTKATMTIGGVQVLAPVVGVAGIADASVGSPAWGVVTVAMGGSGVYDSHLQPGGPPP